MAKKKPKVELPIAPLPDLVNWWQAQGTRGIVIGGLAVALLGRPRLTRDVDGLVLLDEACWPAFLDAARSFGFMPRYDDTLAFAEKARVMLLRHKATGIDVDISLGCLPFEEEAVDRSTLMEVAGASVPLPAPEDLIIMKAVAHRERDLHDIEGLLVCHAKLDLRRIRRWVSAFADSLEIPDVLADLEKLLARHARRKRGKGKQPP